MTTTLECYAVLLALQKKIKELKKYEKELIAHIEKICDHPEAYTDSKVTFETRDRKFSYFDDVVHVTTTHCTICNAVLEIVEKPYP